MPNGVRAVIFPSFFLNVLNLRGHHCKRIKPLRTLKTFSWVCLFTGNYEYLQHSWSGVCIDLPEIAASGVATLVLLIVVSVYFGGLIINGRRREGGLLYFSLSKDMIGDRLGRERITAEKVIL